MDVIAEGGHLFLGSRFRRLAERLQADVAVLSAEAGISVQPGQFSILVALDRLGEAGVSEAAEAAGVAQPAATRIVAELARLGLVDVRTGDDRRRRRAVLTRSGRSALLRARLLVWPRVAAAVEDAIDGLSGSLLDQLAALEAAIAQTPLSARAGAAPVPSFRIAPWRPELAPAFRAINEEWISSMYRMEPADYEILDHPRETIIDPGGDIRFIEAVGIGLIGACALKKSGPGAFELTKMGVYEAARGLGAGEILLAEMIRRAKELEARKLYLLSNTNNVAAVRLYEKAGFVHSAEIMARYGAAYERCNVAMIFPLEQT